MLLKLDYRINQYPGLWGTEEIAKQWNIDDFDFHMDLMVRRFSLYFVRFNILHL
jgi:hypothetical protein